MTEAGWTRETKPMQMRAIPAMDKERFMAKVIPVPESGCWIWEGSLGRGYGSVFINGESYLAQRTAELEAANKAIAEWCKEIDSVLDKLDDREGDVVALQAELERVMGELQKLECGSANVKHRQGMEG